MDIKLAINRNPNERLCYSVSAGRVNRQLFAMLHNMQYEVILCQFNCNLLHCPKLARINQSMQVLKTNNDINTVRDHDPLSACHNGSCLFCDAWASGCRLC